MDPRQSWAASLISNATGFPGRRGASAQPIVLFTDMGGVQHDCGDTVALFLLRGLEGLGFVRTEAVMVASQSERGLELAVKTAASALGSLGFGHDVPIGVCDSSASPSVEGREVHVATELLRSVLEEAEDHSVALVLTLISKDLASFLQVSRAPYALRV